MISHMPVFMESDFLMHFDSTGNSKEVREVVIFLARSTPAIVSGEGKTSCSKYHKLTQELWGGSRVSLLQKKKNSKQMVW